MIDRLFNLFPWVLAAFLAGVLVTSYQAEIKLEKQYGIRIEEANLRLDIMEGALALATQTKWEAFARKREAIQRLYPPPEKEKKR